MSKVSIIIPTYNRADLLIRTVTSVQNQTLKDFELFIIDDGSTDNTKKVVENLAKKDKRIKYLWQKNSGGAASPKNNAIKYCSGKYITYLDHDDEWLPEKLEKQYNYFENNIKKNIGLVSCNIILINKTKGIEGIHKLSRYKTIEDLFLNGGNYAYGNSSIMIPRYIIDIVGPRDENLKIFEDQDIFIRIALAGYHLDFIDEVLVKYHIDETNLSKDFGKSALDYERFIIKYKNELKKYNKTLSAYYRHLGTMYFLAGETLKTRNAFLSSLRLNPSPRNIMTALFTIFGRKFYLFILNLKRKNSFF